MNTNQQGVPPSFIKSIFTRDRTIDLGYECFTLKSLIGAGGLGVVVKAQKCTGENVALKFLYESPSANSSEMFDRFISEINATKAVGDISESCVKVFECGLHTLDNGTPVPFFAMEYVPGLSLEDLIFARETPFTAAEIYAIMHQITEALADIHHKGIVHRDIKPPNILFDEQRQILKVTDFGISKDLNAATQVTTHGADEDPIILGTIHYLSRYYFESVEVDAADVTEPEIGVFKHTPTGSQVTRFGDRQFRAMYKGPKLDISVLASTILFELTTQNNPYKDSTAPSIVNDIIVGRKLDIKSFAKENPGRIDPRLRRSSYQLGLIDKIIKRATAVDMNKTFESATELSTWLHRFGRSALGHTPTPKDVRSIMARLFGKTLVDEYGKTLSRIENAIRTGDLYEHSENIQRIILLYKLNQSERLLGLIEVLFDHAKKALELTPVPQRECQFACKLFAGLERYGIDSRFATIIPRLSQAIERGVV